MPEFTRHQFRIGSLGQAVSYSHKELQLRWAGRDRSAFCIYVLRDQRSLLYVGESPNGVLRPMKGLKAGYRLPGVYRWRRSADVRDQVIECFVFPLAEMSPRFGQAKLRRALEAEVTYEIRRITGAWPRKMIEIHFSEELREDEEVRAAREWIVNGLKNEGWLPNPALPE